MSYGSTLKKLKLFTFLYSLFCVDSQCQTISKRYFSNSNQKENHTLKTEVGKRHAFRMPSYYNKIVVFGFVDNTDFYLHLS